MLGSLARLRGRYLAPARLFGLSTADRVLRSVLTVTRAVYASRIAVRLTASGVPNRPRPCAVSSDRSTPRAMAVRAVRPTRRALAPWAPGPVTGFHGLPHRPQHDKQEPNERNREENHVRSVALTDSRSAG